MARLVSNYTANGTSQTDEYGTFLGLSRLLGGSGVIQGMAVAANTTPGMNVYVQPGTGLIGTGTSPTNYSYFIGVDTSGQGEQVSIATANTSPRIDYIVAYVNKSQVASTSSVNNTNNVLMLADVQGTPAGSPSVPTTAQIQTTIGAANPYIILAQIAVGGNVTQITSANITDLRTFVTTVNDAALGAASYIDSGLVWTAGSGLNGSMTAGKAYINVSGIMVPASAAAIGSYTFTANQDTYVSINVNGTIAYSSVANNAASPSLPTNSIWLAIVITGASTISSVNTGQVGSGGPAVSGNYLMVSDSNGNLIHPTQNQRIIGYAHTLGNVNAGAGATTTVVQTTVIVPAGRQVKITIGGRDMYNNTAGQYAQSSIYDVTGASQLNGTFAAALPSGLTVSPLCVAVTTAPSTTTTRTYSFRISSPGTGTATLEAGAGYPAFIMVETV